MSGKTKNKKTKFLKVEINLKFRSKEDFP